MIDPITSSADFFDRNASVTSGAIHSRTTVICAREKASFAAEDENFFADCA
jgi:hypothetical protein